VLDSRDNAVRGAPWTFPAIAGGLGVMIAALGANGAASLAALAIEIVFVAFFLRHFAFAISAMRSAPSDLELPLLDTGFEPSVSVLVACKDEESVVEGLVASLLALDYPDDRMEILVVDDG